MEVTKCLKHPDSGHELVTACAGRNVTQRCGCVGGFKHKTRRSKGGSYSLPHLYETFGLVRLTRLGRDVPWVKAWGLVREPDAGKSACPVR
jgi:hypothetical protein